MKRVLVIFAQFLLFLFIDAAGGIFYHPFGVETKLPATGAAPRSFEWDGLLLMLLVYGFILVIEALRKRFRGSAAWSTLALALAALAGYLMKFGFITHNW